MMSVVAVSPTASFVGGVLAGTGLLHADLTVDEVVAALERLSDTPSLWSPAPFASDAELDDRVRPNWSPA